MWLDGLVGALTVGGLGTAYVVSVILAGAEGSRATVLVNAAYPIGDLLLVCLVIGVLGLYSWRPGRAWLLLGAGFAIFGAADSIYLYRLAADAYAPGTVLDSLWLVGASVMALAAWQPPRPAGARRPRRLAHDGPAVRLRARLDRAPRRGRARAPQRSRGGVRGRAP